jgi:hypothetical protein
MDLILDGTSKSSEPSRGSSPQLWEFAGMGAHFSNDFRELRTRISLFEEEAWAAA